MKAGRTLQELAIELHRQVNAKRDFIVNTKDMYMEDCGECFILSKLIETQPNALGFDEPDEVHECVPLKMTNLFHRQLGTALDIPTKYYDKMRTESPALLSWNVDWWLKLKDETHMIRTLDKKARAFLSNRYRRLDNYEIANAVLPVFSEMKDAHVESCEITETRMYIKVVNRRLEAEVSPGDIVQAGVMVSNSEVGLGSVTVMPLVYRLVCANGMIVNNLGKRKLHVGRVIDESWELYSDETLRADDQAFMLKLADIARTAIDETKFGIVIDKLKQTSETPISAPLSQVVELSSKRYGLTQDEQDSVLLHLIEGKDLSLYGLSSAVTKASQDVINYDRATALETIGWQLANTNRRDWSDWNA